MRSSRVRNLLMRAKFVKVNGKDEFYSVLKEGEKFFAVHVYPIPEEQINFYLWIICKYTRDMEKARLLLEFYYHKILPSLLAYETRELSRNILAHLRLIEG